MNSNEITPGHQGAFGGIENLDAWDRQHVFREMVIHMLCRGPLTRRRRKQLVQFAAILGLSAIQAGRLIEQAGKLIEHGTSSKAPLRLHNPIARSTRPGDPTVGLAFLSAAIALVISALFV